jgi:hypothetical protein
MEALVVTFLGAVAVGLVVIMRNAGLQDGRVTHGMGYLVTAHNTYILSKALVP